MDYNKYWTFFLNDIFRETVVLAIILVISLHAWNNAANISFTFDCYQSGEITQQQANMARSKQPAKFGLLMENKQFCVLNHPNQQSCNAAYVYDGIIQQNVIPLVNCRGQNSSLFV